MQKTGVLLNGSFEIWIRAMNLLKILRKGETFEKCPLLFNLCVKLKFQSSKYSIYSCG